MSFILHNLTVTHEEWHLQPTSISLDFDQLQIAVCHLAMLVEVACTSECLLRSLVVLLVETGYTQQQLGIAGIPETTFPEGILQRPGRRGPLAALDLHFPQADIEVAF